MIREDKPDRKEWLRLLCVAQDWRCYYCGGAMLRSKRFHQAAGYPSLERLTEGRNGGGYVEGNMVAACRVCNSARPLVEADEYRSLRRSFIPRGWPPCSIMPAFARKEMRDTFGYPTGPVITSDEMEPTP